MKQAKHFNNRIMLKLVNVCLSLFILTILLAFTPIGTTQTRADDDQETSTVVRAGQTFNTELKNLVIPGDNATKTTAERCIRNIIWVDTPFDTTNAKNVAAQSTYIPVWARAVELDITRTVTYSITRTGDSLVATKISYEPDTPDKTETFTAKNGQDQVFCTKTLEAEQKTVTYSVTYQTEVIGEDEVRAYPVLKTVTADIDNPENETVDYHEFTDGETIDLEPDTVPLYTVELYSEADKVYFNYNCRDMFIAFHNVRFIDMSRFSTSPSISTMLCGSMFKYCYKLESIDISGITAPVEDVSNMFEGCSWLVSLDCSTLNTTPATSTRSMFMGCTSLVELNCRFNTANVTYMAHMFYDCHSLKYLDLHTEGDIWNVSNVTSFEKTFNLTTGLHRPDDDTSGDPYGLNITGWAPTKVTNMTLTFGSCYSDVIDVSLFDVSNVTTLNNTFNNTKYVTELAVENWNISSKCTSLANTFQKCNAQHLDLRNWDVSGVTTAEGMCASGGMVSINCAGWNAVNLTTIKNIFAYCKKLEILDVSGWNTSSLTNVSYAFIQVGSLYHTDPRIEVLDLSSWDLSHVITENTSREALSATCVKVIYSPKIMSSQFITLPSANPTTGQSPWYAHLDDRYVDNGYEGFAQLALTHMVNLPFITEYWMENASILPYLGASYVTELKQRIPSISTDDEARMYLNTTQLQPACRYDKNPSEAPVALWKLSSLTSLYYNKEYMHFSVSDMSAWSDIIEAYTPFTVGDEVFTAYNGGYRTMFNIMSEIRTTSQIGYDETVPQYAHFDITGLLHYTEDDWIALSEELDSLRDEVAAARRAVGYTLDVSDTIPLIMDNYGIHSNDLFTPICTLKALSLVEDDDYITFGVGGHHKTYTVYDMTMTGDFDLGVRVFLNDYRTSNVLLPSFFISRLEAQTKIPKLDFTCDIPIYGRTLAFSGSGDNDEDFGVFIIPGTSASGDFDLCYTVDRRIDKIFVGLWP